MSLQVEAGGADEVAGKILTRYQAGGGVHFCRCGPKFKPRNPAFRLG
jgi:hypothetical protein